MKENNSELEFTLFTPLSRLADEVAFFKKYADILFKNRILKILDIVRLKGKELAYITGCDDQELALLQHQLVANGMTLGLTLGQVTTVFTNTALANDLQDLAEERITMLALNGIHASAPYVLAELETKSFPIKLNYVNELVQKIQKFIDQEVEMRAYWKDKIQDIYRYS